MKTSGKARLPAPAEEAAELRRRAELRLSVRQANVFGLKDEAERQRLQHELEVHQIELEMQNEELQQTAAKLEELVQKFTDLYDFAPVGYLTLAADGLILEVNLTGTTLLAATRAQLLERRFGLRVAAASLPAFNEFLGAVFASQVRQRCELTLPVENQPPLEVSLEGIAFDHGLSCRVALTDITERKRAEADRLILNKLESTGILAGGIAHDFNNLLTVVLLNIEMAQMLGPKGKELAERLEDARRTGLLAKGLTAQLVTFAEGGTPYCKLIHLKELICESVRPALSGSKVKAEFSLAPDLWLAAVDAGQIGQVLRNLVMNAREAMPSGGTLLVQAQNLTLSAHEQPELPPGDYVRLLVKDSGAGMAREILSKVFDPYFSTKQRGDQKGMGLGLTICHSVIQKHGGAITVTSTVGVGTTFYVFLPATRAALPEPKPAGPKTPGLRGKILVMDDEEGMRKALEIWLRKLGHEVAVAEDGLAALEKFNAAKASGQPFDVVILDLLVPGGMGGEEAIQALRRSDPGVKGVVMSGYATSPIIMNPEHYGFQAALAKPFLHEQLRQTLARLLGSQTGYAY